MAHCVLPLEGVGGATTALPGEGLGGGGGTIFGSASFFMGKELNTIQYPINPNQHLTGCILTKNGLKNTN